MVVRFFNIPAAALPAAALIPEAPFMRKQAQQVESGVLRDARARVSAMPDDLPARRNLALLLLQEASGQTPDADTTATIYECLLHASVVRELSRDAADVDSMKLLVDEIRQSYGDELINRVEAARRESVQRLWDDLMMN
ncbi:MAG: hypothetical protein KGJ62_12670 [Armatimonadetes bacterium]|nr:hypothetical protein [Armatimonadota bacterium]MDE2207973.1 hypothetical protein [Armatimonadota bacterium]